MSSIFIGRLPGEDEVKLLVNGETAAVFVGEVTHPTTGEPIDHPFDGADKLIAALVNGKGGWTFTHDPTEGELNQAFWLHPKESNQENPIRLKPMTLKPKT